MAPAGTEPWAKHTHTHCECGSCAPTPGLVLSPAQRVMGEGWTERRCWKALKQLSPAATSLHSRLSVLHFHGQPSRGIVSDI